MTERVTRWIAVGIALVLIGAACDSGGGGGGDLAAFCGLAAELDEQDEEPSADQLGEIVDAAPGEIRDEIETLANALQQIEDDPESAAELFGDEELLEAGERVEQFQDENCDEGDDEDGGDEGDADADRGEEGDGGDEAASAGDGDVERFCEITNQTDDRDPETLSDWVLAAPSDLTFDVGVVVDSILAEELDNEPAFDEAQLAESTSNIDEFVQANC